MSSDVLELSPVTRRRALAVSVIDGLMHAVMLGVTDNYLSALAVELGHGPTHQALLATLPVLAGAAAQLAAPVLTQWFGSRKRFVVACAVLQAVTHLWFIHIAHHEVRALGPLLFAKTLYFMGGSMLGPAWSAWMASLTMGPGREQYFARRSGAIHAVLLAAFALGASWLGPHLAGRALLDVFVKLFWVGLVARTLSSFLLAAQHDPDRQLAGGRNRLRIADAIQHADWRVATYMAMLMFGANVAAPFFVPYWLHELKLDYRHYALLVGTSVLCKALSYPTFHRVAARYGMERLLYSAGLVVALLPGAWAITQSFSGFVLIQMVSGVAWGALEYTSFQLLLKSAEQEVRLEFLSLAGAISGLAQVGGSLLGSALIERAGLSYVAVFTISSAMRGLPLVIGLSRVALLRRGHARS